MARDLAWDLLLATANVFTRATREKECALAAQGNCRRPRELGGNIKPRPAGFNQVAHATRTDEVGRKGVTQQARANHPKFTDEFTEGKRESMKSHSAHIRWSCAMSPRVSTWPHRAASVRGWAGLGFISNHNHSQTSR